MFVISKPQNILNTYRETRSFHSKKGLFSPGRKTTLAKTGSNCTSLEQLQKTKKKKNVVYDFIVQKENRLL